MNPTQRELGTLRVYVEEGSAKATAFRMKRNVHTVELDLMKLRKKLGLHGPIALVNWAYKVGLVYLLLASVASAKIRHSTPPSVTVAWTEGVNGCVFQLQYGPQTNSLNYSVLTFSTNTTISGAQLMAGTTYYFSVRAAYTNQVAAPWSPATPVIAYTEPTTH